MRLPNMVSSSFHNRIKWFFPPSGRLKSGKIKPIRIFFLPLFPFGYDILYTKLNKVSCYSNHFVILLNAYSYMENNVYEQSKPAMEAMDKNTDQHILGEFRSQLSSLTAMVTAYECGLLLTDKISVW